MSDTYILKGHETVLCDSLLEWGKKFTQTDRHVAVDEQGEVQVSTVFLGLDHQYGEGPPLLFETMVFGWFTEWRMLSLHYMERSRRRT